MEAGSGTGRLASMAGSVGSNQIFDRDLQGLIKYIPAYEDLNGIISRQSSIVLAKFALLDRHVGARESWFDSSAVVIDDSLDCSIQARPKKEQTAQHDEAVEDGLHASPCAAKQIRPVHLPIRNCKEDEPKERVKSGTEQTEKILGKCQ